MSVFLSHSDFSLWTNKTLSYEGIAQAISNKDPQTAEYIIKLVQMDPMPKSWFYINDENDDLKNPKRIERTKAETYSEESTQAKDIINSTLDTLCDKTKMKELMKTRYFASSDNEGIEDMSLFTDGINRELIKEIYAQLGTELWEQIQKIDSSLIPARLKMDSVLIDLYETNSLFARTQLFEIIRYIPLRYGVWHGIKSIFRKSIEDGDWEMFGICAIRFEEESKKGKVAVKNRYYFNPETYESAHQNRFYYSYNSNPDISKNSLRWLTRRAWMVMREVARIEPDLYANLAVEVLREITTINWWELKKGWLLPHIISKGLLEVQATRKSVLIKDPEDYDEYYEDLSSRAFPELWALDIAPILRLFETARCEEIRNYAILLLNYDFADSMSELPLDFISRVLACKTYEGVDLVYKWLSTNCGFTQDEFIDRGVHTITISLLKAGVAVSHDDASEFAAHYITNHAQELENTISTTDIIWILNQYSKNIQHLGLYLFQLKEYQSKFDLDDWTTIYKTIYNKNTSKEEKSAIDFAKQSIISSNKSADNYSWFYNQFKDGSDLTELCLSILSKVNNHPQSPFMEFVEELLCSPDLFDYHEGIWNVAKKIQGSTSFVFEFSAESQRMIFLGPISENYKEAVKNSNNPSTVLSGLGIDFLKLLLDSKSWKKDNWISFLGKWGASLQDAFQQGLFNRPTEPFTYDERNSQYSKYGMEWDYIQENIYTFFRDTDAETIGPRWIKENIENTHSDFDIIREIAMKKLPLSSFGEEPTETIISSFEKSKFGTKYFDFLSELLTIRFNPYRRFHDREEMDELPEELALKNPSWKTIERLINSTKTGHRTLGLFFTKYLIRDYSVSVPLGFTELQELFMSPFSDVRSFFAQCIEESNLEYGYLDFSAQKDNVDIYQCSDLFLYLNHANFRIRDIAIKIITKYPHKFAKLEDLFSLSTNPDRRIRELIVTQLWNQYKNRSITLHWKPFAQSRVPQSPSSRRPINIHTEKPKGTISSTATEWYIGNGVEEFNKESIQFENIEDFIRYVLFRLPPKMPLLSQSKRLSEKGTAWKNKVSLIEALSNVAIHKIQSDRDTACAESFLSIFEELLESESKTEKEALLVAKTKITRALAQNS